MADQPLIDRLDSLIDTLVARGDASAALGDAELAPLARIAADLRYCPNREFTARLRAQLERRTMMSTAVASHVEGPPKGGHYVREGFTTVTPYIWAPDRGLVDFLIRTFDAVETNVMENDGHGLHRELRIGNSMVMIGETGDQKPGLSRPVALHVFVDDADATFARAIAAGGTSMGDPSDAPFGERAGYVRDAYGNHWYIAHPISSESLFYHVRSVTPFLHAHDVRGYIEFLVRAFGAVEEMVVDHGGHIPYARVRMGDAAVELGTSDPMPGAYFLYVSDPDAVYAQALAAGATSLSAPADRPSGGRIGFVEDPVGNHWYIARPA